MEVLRNMKTAFTISNWLMIITAISYITNDYAVLYTGMSTMPYFVNDSVYYLM